MLKYVGLEVPPLKRLNVCCQSDVVEKLIPKVWTMYWNEWSPHIFTLWSWVTEDPLKSGKEHILIIVWSISWGKHTNWLCLFETPIGYRRRLKGTHLGSNTFETLLCFQASNTFSQKPSIESMPNFVERYLFTTSPDCFLFCFSKVDYWLNKPKSCTTLHRQSD